VREGARCVAALLAPRSRRPRAASPPPSPSGSSALASSGAASSGLDAPPNTPPGRAAPGDLGAAAVDVGAEQRPGGERSSAHGDQTRCHDAAASCPSLGLAPESSRGSRTRAESCAEACDALEGGPHWQRRRAALSLAQRRGAAAGQQAWWSGEAGSGLAP